jgi:hypothetical protein
MNALMLARSRVRQIWSLCPWLCDRTPELIEYGNVRNLTAGTGGTKIDMISDVVGANGRRMLKAMIAGEADPQKLAALASRALAASQQLLRSVFFLGR